MRASFFANWQKHWGYIRDVAPYADIHTLIGFLRSADTTELWNQRNLEEWQLPYVCLATCDFPPPTGVAAVHRPEWLRFRFDDRYRTLRDLWIESEPDFTFLRLTYRKPARKKEPGPTEFIKADYVDVDRRWLEGAYATPHKYVIAAMDRAFPS